MKTYIICTSPRGNSISNYFFSIAVELVSRNNKVILLLDKGAKKEFEYNGVIIRYWPSNRPTRLKDFKFFYKLCREFSPDAVLGMFGSTNITILVSKLLQIPNRMLYWHTMFEQLKIDSKSGKIKRIFRHAVKRNILYYCSTHILTNSNETKKDIVSNYKITENRITVLHYLLNDYFEGQLIKNKNDRFHGITFVGRIDRSKGQELIIDLIPSILHYDPKLKFVFLGDGSERKRLERKCIDLGIQSNVTFLGGVSLEKVYDTISKSLLNISASKQEAFGLVNVEALSAGTPILATYVGGIKDIISEGYNGYFFNPESNTDIVDKIKLIIEDWDQFSKNARESFLDNYAVKNRLLLNSQIDVFLSLLKEK